MSKMVRFNKEARESMLTGINILADAVKITLGPKGKNAIIEKDFGPQLITNDGVTIAKEIELDDPFENLGARAIKEVAIKTNDKAGDGTTTATVLAQHMINQGMYLINNGVNPVHLRMGMNAALKDVVKNIEELSIPITDEMIKDVASLSAADEEVGQLISDAMKVIGRDGVITLEDSRTLFDELEIVNGYEFERGFISHYMVNDEVKMQTVYNNCFVLITDRVISDINEVLGLIEAVNKTSCALLIICKDLEGTALTTITVNTMKGNIKCVAVKAPGIGDRTNMLLSDIGKVTGGKVFYEEFDEDLNEVSVSLLGFAKTVKVTANSTTIIDGEGPEDGIALAREAIKELIDNGNAHDKEFHEQRLATLSSGVAIIKVGAATETELNERKLRIEDALNASKAALKEGVVPGGGMSYIKCCPSKKELYNKDVTAGYALVCNALMAPFNQICVNAGDDPIQVLKEIPEDHEELLLVYDALDGQYTSMFESGIMDPTTVNKTAIINSVSIASTFLTTDVAIVNLKK